MPCRPIVSALPCLLATGCAATVGSGQIPPVAIADARPSPVPLPGVLRLPAGPGPYPVVILLHGCGGVSPGQGLWADRLAGWGYGSLILDTFTPRGIRSVCARDRQRMVTRFDRAGDAIAAARWLQTQPSVDSGRIAALGISHGGATAATLAIQPFAGEAAGLIKAVVDYYGACRTPARYAGTPLLALAGTADTWGDPARQCQAFAATVPPGSPVTLAIYPDVVHGFENPRNERRTFPEAHPMQYDPAAATDSYAKVHAFLESTIGPGR